MNENKFKSYLKGWESLSLHPHQAADRIGPSFPVQRWDGNANSFLTFDDCDFSSLNEACTLISGRLLRKLWETTFPLFYKSSLVSSGLKSREWNMKCCINVQEVPHFTHKCKSMRTEKVIFPQLQFCCPFGCEIVGGGRWGGFSISISIQFRCHQSTSHWGVFFCNGKVQMEHKPPWSSLLECDFS